MVLTEEQLARIEENRKRALALREQREQEKQQVAPPPSQEVPPGQGPSASAAALQALQQQAGFCTEGVVTEAAAEPDATPTSKPISTASTTHNGVAPHAPAASGGGGDELICSECGNCRADTVFHTTFGVLVCAYCKADNEEDYGLMSKADAVAEFLVQEGTMRVLPYLEKSNPRHSSWTKMKLYLRKQVREKSYARWGGG